MWLLHSDQADKLAGGTAAAVGAAAGVVRAVGGPTWLTVALVVLAFGLAVLALILNLRQASRAAAQPLPLEPSLAAVLAAQKDRSQRMDVPFLTPQVLLALLAPPKGPAVQAFDAVRPGLAGYVRNQLEAYERSGAARQADMHFSDFHWADRPDVRRASALARRERASEIDQRHLLVAVLESPSGTVTSLRERLGQAGFDQVLEASRSSVATPAVVVGTPGAVFGEGRGD
jgi:hypothetical protein